MWHRQGPGLLFRREEPGAAQAQVQVPGMARGMVHVAAVLERVRKQAARER